MSQDGFGTRTLNIDQETGDPVEVLTFAPQLARAPEFAAAVGERVTRLARVRHAMYARTRKLERTSEGTLRLVSDHIQGWRLDHVLDIVENEQWTLDVTAVITLLRQLIPAVALFSRHQREATIGTIGPERLILTPQGRLVLAEYVLAPGLEKLQLPRERLWREFRVAIPGEGAVTRIPPTADVVGIGVVAVSLLLNRRLKDDEYLVSLGDLIDALNETSDGITRKLSSTFWTWAARALQFETDTSFTSVHDAQLAFEDMLARERAYVTTTGELDRFIANFERVAGAPHVALPAPPEGTASKGSGKRAAASSAQSTASSSSGYQEASAHLAPNALDALISSGVSAPATAPDVPKPTTPRKPGGGAAVTAAETVNALTALVAPSAVMTPGIHSREAAAAAAVPSAPVTPGADVATVALAAPSGPDAPTAPSAPSIPSAPSLARFALPAAVAAALIEAGVIAWLLSSSSAGAQGGTITVQSRPVAARVSIDGEERGITPFEGDVTPGSHVIEVRVGKSEPRVIPVMIREGVQTGLYVELQSVATVGGLEVRSDPVKAKVTVSGQYRGETPLLLKDLPPGEVEVLVQSSVREVRQKVRIEPGITSQLVVPLGR